VRKTIAPLIAAFILIGLMAFTGMSRQAASQVRVAQNGTPTLEETATLTFAPQVPPPIKRREPAVVKVALTTIEVEGVLMEGIDKPTTYKFWTYNGHVPGPFIRTRVGDILDLDFRNDKTSTASHNIDFHAVTGPGGGGKATITPPGGQKKARFKLLNPGLYVYHCAVPPIPHHVANGMYGLILVEPEGGLPPVDREYYVMQSEFYTKGKIGDEGLQAFDPLKGAAEQPTYVVFNGRVGSLQGKGALQAHTGERVRLFVGNGGPNLTSSFHVIGEIFENVYFEGSTKSLGSNVQTTSVPAGGSAIVDFKLEYPGDYTLVDHSVFRFDKGCMGTLHVEGAPLAPDIFVPLK